MQLDKHPILKEWHDLIQAIEVCGCSVELTDVVTKAVELGYKIDHLVDELHTAIQHAGNTKGCSCCGKKLKDGKTNENI